jgi:hypothetical protein
MKTLVSFREYGNHPLRGILKDGFKHVVIAIQTGDYWVEIDYAVGVPITHVIAHKDYDLLNYYARQGYTVVKRDQEINKQFNFNLFRGNIFVANCVGLTKALLGLNSWALTPYQLYKRLIKP